MSQDTLRTVATYVIAVLILAGAFVLIYQARGDVSQAWLAVGAVLGYVFRDAGGAAATRNVERIAASQPTVTTTSGPPATTTVTPTEGAGE
jgi:hypothetical protein